MQERKGRNVCRKGRKDYMKEYKKECMKEGRNI
jgi:hypothetical protein